LVRVEIAEAPLQVERSLGLPGGVDGAIVEFQGIVRENEAGDLIEAIDYTSHLEMARIQLSRIAEEVAEAYRLSTLVVLHRIGIVPVGETSLYVRAIAPHRREAFEAAEALIVRLKEDVPIWKVPRPR